MMTKLSGRPFSLSPIKIGLKKINAARVSTIIKKDDEWEQIG
jgi:hypothetical protein